MLLDAVHAAWYLGKDEIADSADRLDALPLPPDDPLTHVVRLLTELAALDLAEVAP